jgi:hypothetical protein
VQPAKTNAKKIAIITMLGNLEKIWQSFSWRLAFFYITQ